MTSPPPSDEAIAALSPEAAPAPAPAPAQRSPVEQPGQQPYLHELVSCVRAPTTVLSGPDGQIRAGGVQGAFCHDRRVLSALVVEVDEREPVPVGHGLLDAGRARFTGVVRHLGDPTADPTVWLERDRRATPDGCRERLELLNASRAPISVTVGLRVAADLAGVSQVKTGAVGQPRPALLDPAGLRWAAPDAEVRLRATGEPAVAAGQLRWAVTVPAQSRWRAEVTLTVSGPALAANAFPAAAGGPGWAPVTVDGPPALVASLTQGIADVAALTLADPLAPGDRFPAAGSPWYLTLFGRDSLWSARMLLPLGTELAAGTLRTLARRQGRRHDETTGEAPGKILHEVRTSQAHGSLPPVYYGTIDATALWICLLQEAWQWGMPAGEVADLLPALRAALGWLTGHTDGSRARFLAYRDRTGAGLANQGWKDSEDAVQFPDARLAAPPIALSEAQAYAYQAALAGATLLDAFDQPGADRVRGWAAELRARFRDQFWVSDPRGRYPAIALDGDGHPVPTATSNLGHLLGTGLLAPAEAGAVAARLAADDLDCGYGLRTMSADAAGFNPLGYHTGSVWPHDTAIAVGGLVAEGHGAAAASLADGLLRAAPAFGYRLPELFAGTGRGGPVLAYPASCRPQAWSAGAPVALLAAALGISPQVPAGVLRVAPHPAFGHWFPLRVRGLRLAGHPLTVSVDRAGRVEVETTAPVQTS